jgi:hypothetical protein
MSATSNRFGIIRTLPSGIPQWLEAVEGLAEAKAYLMRLAVREPGEFYIYSETSGVIVERFVCVGIDQNNEGGEETTETIEISSHAARFLN